MAFEAIPYFFVDSFIFWGERIYLSVLALILGRLFINTFVSFYEAKRLRLSATVILGMLIIEFFFSPLFSQGTYLISRVVLHGEKAKPIIDQTYTVGGISGEVQIGGLIGNILAIFLGAYLFGVLKDFYKYLDIKMFAYTISLIPVRIATGLKHLHLGTVTNVPWGIEFPDKLVRHEPSFYEALSLGIIFIIALCLRKKITRPGLLSLIILAWISLSRVVTDNFRSVETDMIFRFGFGLTLNQIAYGLVFIVTSWAMHRIWKEHKKTFFSGENL